MRIPADCAACPGGDCPRKETCFRFVAELNEWQWQMTEAPNIDDRCLFYWPITEERSERKD